MKTDPIEPEDVTHAVEHAIMSTGPLAGKKIIFDTKAWHPLDHRMGSKRCRAFPNDINPIKLHWRLWKEFKREADLAWAYRLTHCRFGRHRYQTWTRVSDGTALTWCVWCAKLPPKGE